MASWLYILLLLIALIFAVVLSIVIASRNVQSIIAPDIKDAEAIDAALGENTPEAKTARTHRLGPGNHWKDALTAVGGMLGLYVAYRIWFT